jgi:CRISPR-associated protein Cas2
MMVVITLTDCPISLRGDLTKWLIEINTGVFVGQVGARIRDNLWERVTSLAKDGCATMVFSANNEQHFDFRVYGATWLPIDFDGIKLMMRPSAARTKKLSGVRLGFSKASQYKYARQKTATKRQEMPASPFHTSYIVIDIETTGLNAEKDEVIEISALKAIDGKAVESFSEIINAPAQISSYIEELTGISNEIKSEKGKPLGDVLDGLLSFIQSSVIIGHNIDFDVSFLNAACVKCGKRIISNKSVDTLVLSREYVKNVASHKLTSLMRHFDIRVNVNSKSLSDCYVTHELYQRIIGISNHL